MAAKRNYPSNEELIREFSKEVKKIKSVPQFKIKQQKGKKEETAVLEISDVHLGKKTETYNLEQFVKRMNTLLASVSEVTELVRRNCNVKKLHIFLLGDILDGEEIFPNHQVSLEHHLFHQLIYAEKHFSSFITSLLEIFEEIEVDCVYGNHGRKSKSASPKTNFDLIFYKMLEVRFEQIKRVNFNISEDFYNYAEVAGKRFLLVHGHQFVMTSGTPWYSILRAVANWSGSLPKQFDYMTCGHFHITGMIPWNTKRVILNGTFSSSDDFSQEVVKQIPTNTQWFFGVNQDRITWRYELELLKKDEMQKLHEE